MTEVFRLGDDLDALPLGPQSLVWRYFGDNRMFLIGPRPAVLQNMLAELGQGVLDHSVFFTDTAARVKRSLPPIFMTVYGSDDDHPGRQVRDFHHEIKGQMPDGKRYHALDPETYYWAHATFVEQVIYFADTFVKRLTRPKKSRSTSSPRRGIAAMVSASGPCRSTTPSSNGIGTACSTEWWSRTRPRNTVSGM
ncbi:hypothetical protein I552_6984 [Mycobacterium xenopi 3993]|nr:hypothetical protein I552_6984 [Mycobacterium xenopi 3993]